jgi:hypothetical protein
MDGGGMTECDGMRGDAMGCDERGWAGCEVMRGDGAMTTLPRPSKYRLTEAPP